MTGSLQSAPPSPSSRSLRTIDPPSSPSSRDGTSEDMDDLLGLSDSTPMIQVVNPSDDDTAPSSTDDPVYRSAPEKEDEDDGIYGDDVRPLIYGYLHKLGRNGKWQKRFFETDGECLSYFKSSNRTKLLATLDLYKVGAICISAEDPSGCTFHIQIGNRPYNLRAETSGMARYWVITLNRVKEARLQLGNVELVSPKFTPPRDLLTGDDDDRIQARVVVKAHRQRTRAVEDAHDFERMVEAMPDKPETAYSSTHLERVGLAKWNKPQNTLYRLKIRVIKWARSIRSCVIPKDQVLLTAHAANRPEEKTQARVDPSASSDEENEPLHFIPAGEDGETRQFA